MPAAEQFKPKAGVCHERTAQNGRLVGYAPVACTKSHAAETIYVGELPSSVADLKTSPKAGDKASAPAWSACGKEASNKFGRNWLDFRLSLIAYWPGDTGWTGGARWLRCDVVVPRDMYAGSGEVSQDAALTDKVLEGLALGCFDFQESTGVDSLVNSPCDGAHNAEYAGSFQMPAGTKVPAGDEAWDDVHSGCYSVIAEFIGVRPSAVETGTLSIPEDSTWSEDGGDNAVRCYLWLDEKKMTGSAKGTRGVGIPA